MSWIQEVEQVGGKNGLNQFKLVFELKACILYQMIYSIEPIFRENLFYNQHRFRRVCVVKQLMNLFRIQSEHWEQILSIDKTNSLEKCETKADSTYKTSNIVTIKILAKRCLRGENSVRRFYKKLSTEWVYSFGNYWKTPIFNFCNLNLV